MIPVLAPLWALWVWLPKLRSLGGRRLGTYEIVMHAELKRDGVKYAARQPHIELARQYDEQAQEVPVES